MQSFLKALQSRNIDGVAVTYAVAGWLLVQVASVVFPAFAAPVWALRGFIVTVIVGFPAALTIAWFTAPQTRTVDAPANGISPREVVLLALLGVVLLLSFGELGFVILHGRASQERLQNTPVEASIAVLPFENLSSDKDAGYFAAGVQDEILTRLTKIGTLKVISRRSTDHFASQPDDLPKIASQLGVANILEGSVQKVGDSVHINVQLISAATDAHLWAEVYDRKLEDVFVVEGEVATAIAEALNAKISGTEKRAITTKATSSPAAHDAYLRALVFYRKTDFSADNNHIAEQLLQQAVKLDPNYAAAWALLAHVNALDFFNDVEPRAEHRRAARTALDAAVRLQPEMAEVRLEQGYYQYWAERNYEAARRIFEGVRADWPNNGAVLEALAYITRRQGQWNRSLTYFDRAIALDPLDPSIRFTAVETLEFTRDYSRALRQIDDALNIWPDNHRFIAVKFYLYRSLGQLNLADGVLSGAHPEPDLSDSDLFEATINQAMYRQHYGDAIRLLEQQLAAYRSSATDLWEIADLNADLGDARRRSGDADGALVNYTQARDGMLSVWKNDPDGLYEAIAIGRVYCRLGDRKAAAKYGERARSLALVTNDALANADAQESRARIDACLGDGDRAIPELARLLKSPGYLTPAILQLDPDFDKLRSDPRFEALVREGRKGPAIDPARSPM